MFLRHLQDSQRWADPGEKGNHTLHFFWTCCGADTADAPGCCRAQHVSYDEAREDGDGTRADTGQRADSP